LQRKEVVDALGATRGLAGSLDRGQKQGDQDGNDRDDDQELDQGERSAVPWSLDGAQSIQWMEDLASFC
jgi:hypothetical protein